MSAPDTSTPLERHVAAAVATLGAWCYPSDHRLRNAAERACVAVGVDYLESVARIMLASPDVSAHVARQKVAAGFVVGLAQMVEQGAEPRSGVYADAAAFDDDTEVV